MKFLTPNDPIASTGLNAKTKFNILITELTKPNQKGVNITLIPCTEYHKTRRVTDRLWTFKHQEPE
ncbi:hypothetical protein Hanom_Chr00s000405g01642831 [Helianthus anomalus]